MPPFVGEIRMFGGNFNPNGWAFCNGATIPISQNDVLFNLIGTTYGGDGQSTFQLPDLQGRFPIHQGTGSGLSTYVIGQKAGVETVTLTTQQIPNHTHQALCYNAGGNANSPANGEWAVGAAYYINSAPNTNMGSLGSTGGSQPHDNMIPFLCVTFIISLFGIFPSQN
jgi:microcystin-dependent protein